MNIPPTTALIAEDEALLAQALQAELKRAWPELRIVGVAQDGLAAVREALALRPDVLFFDVRMPGQSGLEAAAELADAWPDNDVFPALVFVTAYDEYAVSAFEAQAIDYVLKPVHPDRLARTVARVRQHLVGRHGAQGLEDALSALRRLLTPVPSPPQSQPQRLQVIRAGVGNTIRMIPIDEVICLEAADKYVRVLTRDSEALVRTPLRELLPLLDPQSFWQIHRGTVVRAQSIETVRRDPTSGKLELSLRGRGESYPVSRLYANRFKAM